MAASGRRTRRSARLTGALSLLVLAGVVVVAAVVLGDLLAVSVAAVAALAAGTTSYLLVRGELLAARRANAVERRDLAREYRDLFARRADETTRQHDRLREALGHTERRASGAEAMLGDVRRRLGEAEDRYAAMEAYAVSESREDEQTLPVRLGERGPSLPEWARLESDPVQALLAWEEHAGRVAGAERTELRKHA
ncbi:hypothetical protein GCM10011519_18650 [Marmoricola endophyticus]|uniref:Uncharacterized protein n=1 Tax=Marmoricola endophyticus TaxID=2040280 RepID=A0A917BH56_9ACTN|nr:hypothetical protein [Marmoricola endophyticus]GGF45088.1 hypothetical protein GCM10011519_18650 [Marmoricola endophyticus]